MAIKVGDIIDFSLEIGIDIPKEDEGSTAPTLPPAGRLPREYP